MVNETCTAYHSTSCYNLQESSRANHCFERSIHISWYFLNQFLMSLKNENDVFENEKYLKQSICYFRAGGSFKNVMAEGGWIT